MSKYRRDSQRRLHQRLESIQVRHGGLKGVEAITNLVFRCDSIAKQKQFITAHKNTLGNHMQTELLDKVYKNTFGLLLQQGQRSAEKSTCIEFWRTLFSPPSLKWSTPSFNWLEEWIKFINGPSGVKGISRDQWNHVLKFARFSLQDQSLSFHNEEQSWPALIDDFVAHVRDLRGDKKGGEDDVDMEY
jgi:DCN1-like protein 1/2